MKPTKAHRICFVLLQAGGSLTRVEILERVHQMENSRVPFKESSNRCYFRRSRCMDSNSSLILKGLIVVEGKVGSYLTYALTEKGEQLAKDYSSVSGVGQWQG